MKGHFKVEWHAAQSVQEVLQRDSVQFPSFIMQMSRVGRDGEVGQRDTCPQWYAQWSEVGQNETCPEWCAQWFKEAGEIKTKVGGSSFNKVGGGTFDNRNTARMIQLPARDPKVWWQKVRVDLELRAQERRLQALRSMLVAVATKQAWGRMENFAKSGQADGRFDVTCLIGKEQKSMDQKKEKTDWEAISNLISAATEAAVGAGIEREEEEMVELL